MGGTVSLNLITNPLFSNGPVEKVSVWNPSLKIVFFKFILLSDPHEKIVKQIKIVIGALLIMGLINETYLYSLSVAELALLLVLIISGSANNCASFSNKPNLPPMIGVV